MMPPICCICDEDFEPGKGGLIYFVEDEEDKIANQRLRQPGFVGHPPNAFWFCAKHYTKAKKISHLTKHEAFSILKQK
ncbi:MAG: hypothetical protein B6I20_06550 [Bacteroidetes bacterium 4572_117]|nr:MAG: hypothetical protein B6I20_06550 [Bacteroidetes bacterium 4572_117]